MLLTAQAIGTLCRIASVIRMPQSALSFFTKVMQFTLVHFSGLVPVFLTLTTRRTKMVQLVTKLSAVDTDLNLCNDNMYKKHKTKILICLVSFTVLIVPTYGLFIYYWQSDDILNGITLNLSDFTWLMSDMEFVNIVMLLRGMLAVLNKRIASIMFVTELRSRRTAPLTTHHVARDGGYRCLTTSRFGSEFLEMPFSVQHFNTFNPFSAEEMYYQSKVTERIVNCRRIYKKLYDICCFVNSMYGFTLLLSAVTNIVSFVSYVNFTIHYMLTPYSSERGVVSTKEVIPFLASSLMTGLEIIAVTLPCQKTSEECQKCVDSVQKLLLQTDQKAVVRQLRLFCNQLENNRIEFTANGFFAVNFSLLTALTGVTVTYIILLVQI
jgi:hypothetical protein